jgi:methyl-accepting chemotaxis protein WspA
MLRNLKIGLRLSLLVALLGIVALTAGLVGLNGMRTTSDRQEYIYANYVLPLAQMKAIGDSYSWEVVDNAHKARLGLLPHDEALRRVEAAERIIDQQWRAYLTTDKAARETEIIADAGPRIARATQEIATLKGLLRARDDAALATWIAARMYQTLDPISADLRDLAAVNDSVIRASYQQAREHYSRTRTLVAATTGIGILLGFLLGWLIIRDILVALRQVTGSAKKIASGVLTESGDTVDRADELGMLQRTFTAMRDNLGALIGEVQRSGIQVNSSATEIAATARQQRTTATEVASTTMQIGATARQISATSQELSRMMRELMGSAETMADLAGAGQQGLSRMEATISQITEATGGINSRFAALSDRAANINSVVTTISKVADQTNLLSLNAAIEAEKAGEYGRGFSVVATEIRRLADQTAISTTEIDQMIREMQSAVSAGVMGMDKFSDAVRRGVDEVNQVSGQIAEIIQHVQAITPRFETVVEGMGSQSEGAQQISDSLTQLGEASQQTADSLAQSTEAIEQLNGAARGLQSAVSRFHLAG